MSLKRYAKRLVIVPVALLGVAVLVVMVKNRQGPVQEKATERATAARVLAARELAVVPRALGYGYVQPGAVWQAVAEVSGQVVEMNPELNEGALIRKGEVLLRIDPQEYGLAQTRDEAQVRNIQAKLSELEQRERNLRQSLATESRSLSISSKELARKRKLADQGTVSRSEVDREEQNYLAQRNKVQDLENSLALVPAERRSLRAQLSQERSRLATTELDVSKTLIRAPFDCRISQVNVELRQFAAAGQVLAKADSIAEAEVLAQFPLSALRNLIPREANPFNADAFTMDDMRRFTGFSAEVRLDMGPGKAVWPARFSRPSESIDPRTRTMGVYVVVDAPYRRIEPGFRPPLVRNMYCEVELRGRTKPPAVVVPRSALDQNTVRVVDADDRLHMRPVEVDFTQGNLAVLKNGVEPGERVVVSDLVPAVEGMLLTPVADEDLAARLTAEALGEGPAR